MDKLNALKTLGLGEGASAEDIQAALKAKQQDIAEKKANAPTDALKAKFESLEAKLAEAEKVLSADSGKSQAADDQGSRSEEAKQTSPSPLSQTKLADLPGLAPQDAAQVELQPGQTIANRYEIKELIGQGGMGAVYRAHDKNTDRDIALKLLLPSLLKNDSARERFLSEAKISQQLSHPNIVNVYDVQSSSPADGSGDLFFLTMELLEGQDLRQWLENLKTVNQPTPIDEVKRIASELCDALAYAHDFTVHRDIKPENIWLDESGKVKLMDFGIARVQSASQRTQTGAAMGTAYYMAPEQLQGRELDARADIYAIGVMLYEMLTGQIPAGRFEPAITLRKEIGKALSAIIDKALSVNPEQRFANAAELKTALQSGKAGKVAKVKSARPASAANLHGGGPNKLAIAVVLLLFLGGGAFAWQQGWLDALKPLDKELIAQQKAEATKLLGQIKRLQRLLDDNLRDLDRDVSDAKRENSKRYATLQTWQDNAEDFITRSATLTDLQGELAVGEDYLRDDKTASKAVESLGQVKQGYEGLLSCFDNLEGFENQQAELKKWQTQWKDYGIGGSVADKVKATEIQIADSVMQGQKCQAVVLTREAISGYQTMQDKVAPVLTAKKMAQKAKNSWVKYKKKYNFTKKVLGEEKAKKKYEEAYESLKKGELVASKSLYQQAEKAWDAVKHVDDVVVHVKATHQAWAKRAAREEEKRRVEQRARELAAEKLKKSRIQLVDFIKTEPIRIVRNAIYNMSKRYGVADFSISKNFSYKCWTSGGGPYAVPCRGNEGDWVNSTQRRVNGRVRIYASMKMDAALSGVNSSKPKFNLQLKASCRGNQNRTPKYKTFYKVSFDFKRVVTESGVNYEVVVPRNWGNRAKNKVAYNDNECSPRVNSFINDAYMFARLEMVKRFKNNIDNFDSEVSRIKGFVKFDNNQSETYRSDPGVIKEMLK